MRTYYHILKNAPLFQHLKKLAGNGGINFVKQLASITFDYEFVSRVYNLPSPTGFTVRVLPVITTVVNNVPVEYDTIDGFMLDVVEEDANIILEFNFETEDDVILFKLENDIVFQGRPSFTITREEVKEVSDPEWHRFINATYPDRRFGKYKTQSMYYVDTTSDIIHESIYSWARSANINGEYGMLKFHNPEIVIFNGRVIQRFMKEWNIS